jgi:uncharacterized protein involved in outer membrane biogenesis
MKALKIVLVIVVVLVLILAGGLFYLTRFVNTPQFKTQVLEAARKAAGTDVKVGEMKVSLFSGVELQDVTVANPSGFAGNLLTAKSFALHYRLWPLLHKRVEVQTLTLDTPVITLAKNSQGDWNYDKLGGSSEPNAPQAQSAEPKPTESKPAGPGGGGLDIAVSQIALKHATVVMVDGAGKELLKIADANFTSAIDLSGGQLTGKGQASIAEAIAANSLFIRQVAAPVTMTPGLIKLAPLTGKIADGEISGEAGLAGSKYSVNLNIKDADIVKLIQEAGVTKKAFSSGKLQVNTVLTGTGGLSTMASNGKVEITGGQFVGVPVLNLIGTVLQIPSLRDLKFEQCQVEYTLTNNVLQTPVVIVKASQVQITGKGSVSLEDYSLNHTLTLALAKDTLAVAPDFVRKAFVQRADGWYTIDFRVWGPYDSPKEDLTKRLATGIGQNLLQQFIK